MDSLFHRRAEDRPVGAAVAALVAGMRYEVVPTAHVERAVVALPPGRGGVGDVLAGQGPRCHAGAHGRARSISATRSCRTCRPASSRDLSTWGASPGGCVSTAVREVFVVAGDVEVPVGPYAEGLTFLRDLLEHDTGVVRVGVPAYPDGHPFIADAWLHDRVAGQAGAADVGRGRRNGDDADVPRPDADPGVAGRRAGGRTRRLPVELGIPGVVDRADADADGRAPRRRGLAAVPAQAPGHTDGPC